MANPLSNPAGNVAPRWIYQAILVEMTDKTLYGLRATQRDKEIRGIFNGGIWPILRDWFAGLRGKNNGSINIFQLSLKTSWCSYMIIFSVLPIDKKIRIDYREGDIYIYIYVYRCRVLCITLFRISIEIYRWAIIEELSIRRRLRIFLISWGQKTRVKHCYAELSSWYEFWFARICISMNTISDLSTTIRQF